MDGWNEHVCKNPAVNSNCFRQFSYSAEMIAEKRDLKFDLETAGPNVAECPVAGMPNTTGEGYVDYALWGDDNLPLAVVEAKRTRKDARQGKRQAELYADALERMTGQRPLIFYSNGYEHWFWRIRLSDQEAGGKP